MTLWNNDTEILFFTEALRSFAYFHKKLSTEKFLTLIRS